MSIRTLIEINHDCGKKGPDDGFLEALNRYIGCADRETAEALERYGVRVLGMRHHSSPYIMDGTPDGFPVQYLERAKEVKRG